MVGKLSSVEQTQKLELENVLVIGYPAAGSELLLITFSSRSGGLSAGSGRESAS